MAFFGLTHLGYQNPIGDKLIVSSRGSPRLWAPSELYLMPVTDNQQYGWLLSQRAEPWIQVKRYPVKHSEMTKFVTEMTKTDPEFTLF
ncbi:uncharacterized protein [Eucyclogobius newberryi]|uniref:uncharacterized protein n=1 Tax=Eucyclogobius newberryi TaxID=166745 RepID=UPI003B59E83E